MRLGASKLAFPIIPVLRLPNAQAKSSSLTPLVETMPSLHLDAHAFKKSSPKEQNSKVAPLGVGDRGPKLLVDEDPDEYSLPDHQKKALMLNQYRNICSEIVPSLYMGGAAVAADRELLKKNNISHIINAAGDVCENLFPDDFEYLTFYVKDAKSEEISVVFYRALEWIDKALKNNKKVLVHCREGVSRSTSIVMAYLTWKHKKKFDEALDMVRRVRPICNPNAGFTFQLLLFAKQFENEPNLQLYRACPHHVKDPTPVYVPVRWEPQTTDTPDGGDGGGKGNLDEGGIERTLGGSQICENQRIPPLDSRFIYILRKGNMVFEWVGALCPVADKNEEYINVFCHYLEVFHKKIKPTISVEFEGNESAMFWNSLNFNPMSLSARTPPLGGTNGGSSSQGGNSPVDASKIKKKAKRQIAASLSGGALGSGGTLGGGSVGGSVSGTMSGGTLGGIPRGGGGYWIRKELNIEYDIMMRALKLNIISSPINVNLSIKNTSIEPQLYIYPDIHNNLTLFDSDDLDDNHIFILSTNLYILENNDNNNFEKNNEKDIINEDSSDEKLSKRIFLWIGANYENKSNEHLESIIVEFLECHSLAMARWSIESSGEESDEFWDFFQYG
eukprot:GHVL01027897.1.p1 GENE.GHVL01027897.1~~GHVL01027897.1.p1  ORF type:complete len:616 (+),score=189.35 GHVL01027897.1:842-2689(+)